MSVVNYNPTTKEQIAAFTDKIVGEVESGAINALDSSLHRQDCG